MPAIDNLGTYAVIFLVAAVTLSIGAVILGDLEGQVYNENTVNNEYHVAGILPANITLNTVEEGIKQVTDVTWENNGQEYVNETHDTLGTLPANISVDYNNNGLGFINGSETVIYDDTTTNTTLTAGDNYTAHPHVSKIEIETVNGYNETSDSFHVTYTTKSNNQSIDKPGQYELVDADAGTVEIKDNITNYASSSDNFYVDYEYRNGSTGTNEVVKSNKEGATTFAGFMPVIAVAVMAAIIIGLLMSRFMGRSR